MAEVKITELTAFTDPVATDLFVAVDASITKKITFKSIEDTISGNYDIGGIQTRTGELLAATGVLALATGSLDVKTQILETATGTLSSYTGTSNFSTGVPDLQYSFLHTGSMSPNNDAGNLTLLPPNSATYAAGNTGAYSTWQYLGQRFVQDFQGAAVPFKKIQFLRAAMHFDTIASDSDFSWSGLLIGNSKNGEITGCKFTDGSSVSRNQVFLATGTTAHNTWGTGQHFSLATYSAANPHEVETGNVTCFFKIIEF